MTVLEGDVRRFSAHWGNTARSRLTHPILFLLDPPRSVPAGLRTDRRDRGPQHIYISCNPASLARDTAYLLDSGILLSSIYAHDIYPMTHHVETCSSSGEISVTHINIDVDGKNWCRISAGQADIWSDSGIC